ncbi:MAG: hypothetical protein ACRELC_01140 [Gemmatimonadota bacterium]
MRKNTLSLAALLAVVACGDIPTDPVVMTETAAALDAAPITDPFDPNSNDEDSGVSANIAQSMTSYVTDCTFTTSGSVMALDGDCTTDATILVPDGMTLDGNGHTITAVDPASDHFRGAVVANGGSWAAVRDLNVTVSNLVNACDEGDDRLRGIMFEGASGEITMNRVVGLNQGPSGCQEGNAIEVRNAPFDGTHPNTRSVLVSHNEIDTYQKTGIVANGDVAVVIEHNTLGASATQQNLAANGIQLGFGASGALQYNHLDGNQWLEPSNFAASAILVFDADVANVSHNRVGGNSDVGLFVSAAGGLNDYNDVRDFGSDGPHGDFGIADVGSGNIFNNSLVCGFVTSVFPDPLPGSQNKALPDPACAVGTRLPFPSWDPPRSERGGRPLTLGSPTWIGAACARLDRGASAPSASPLPRKPSGPPLRESRDT